MKTIGIKLADGSFYPILEEGNPCKKALELTTVKDNQTRVLVDLYRSKTGTMDDAEYVDTLQIDNLIAHPNGEASISLDISLDEDNRLSAYMTDPETGAHSDSNITLVSRTLEERMEPTNYEIAENSDADEPSEIAEEAEFNAPEMDAAETAEMDSSETPDALTEENADSAMTGDADDFNLDGDFFAETENADISSGEEDSTESGVNEAEAESSAGSAESDNDADSAAAFAAGAAAGGLLAAALKNKEDEETAEDTDDFALPQQSSEDIPSDGESEESAVDFSDFEDNFDSEDGSSEQTGGEETVSEPSDIEDSSDTLAEFDDVSDIAADNQDTASADETFVSDTPAENELDSFGLPEDISDISMGSEDFGDPFVTDGVSESEETVDFSESGEPEQEFAENENTAEIGGQELNSAEITDDMPEESESTVTDDASSFDTGDDFFTDIEISDNYSAENSEAGNDAESDNGDTEADSSDESGNDAAAAAAGGLLAAALQNKEDAEPAEDTDDFALPEQTAEDQTEETVFDEDKTEEYDSGSEAIEDETLEMPDFSSLDETVDSNAPVNDGLSDSNEDTALTDSSDEIDFDLPDFSNIDTSSESEQAYDAKDDNFFDTLSTDEKNDRLLVKDNTPSNGINFSGLYDKETELGNSSGADDGDVQKKMKTPVIICIVCAIICVIATLLVLFVVPSKYNLLKAKNTKAPAEEIIAPAAEPEKIPAVVPEAKEDEIVVVTEPELVVPEPPAPPENKPKDITYKIKWGDTLWDIADAYYKNPWRYHMIARYNAIRDPDYIISGTTIVLPAK